MRLGVVTSSFPRYADDHAGVFVLELCRALVERGHTIEVIAPDPGIGAPPKWTGIDVEWAPYFAPRRWQQLCYGAGVPENVQQRPWLAGQVPLLGASLIAAVHRRSKRWDGVISHWLIPSGLAVSWACRGLPHVAVAHSGDVWLLRRAAALGSAALKQIAHGATALATVNPGLAAELSNPTAELSIGWPRVALLPLGPGTVPPARREVRRLLDQRVEAAGIMGRDLIVATIARLVPIKGVDVLISALALPPTWGFSAVVAGEGPERSRLEALARRLGVKAAFLGAINGDERSALLDRADVLAVPSRMLSSGRSEGTPIAAIEGMAAGVPVVASDLGGLSWALGDAGLLCEPGSAERLAGALSTLRDDSSIRKALVHEGHRRSKRFGWSQAAEKLEGLLLCGDEVSYTGLGRIDGRARRAGLHSRFDVV